VDEAIKFVNSSANLNITNPALESRLQNYIQTQLNSGYSLERIKDALIKQGFNPAIIAAASSKTANINKTNADVGKRTDNSKSTIPSSNHDVTASLNENAKQDIKFSMHKTGYILLGIMMMIGVFAVMDHNALQDIASKGYSMIKDIGYHMINLIKGDTGSNRIKPNIQSPLNWSNNVTGNGTDINGGGTAETNGTGEMTNNTSGNYTNVSIIVTPSGGGGGGGRSSGGGGSSGGGSTPITPTCSGETNQLCTDITGNGSQSRTCNSGVWTDWSTCSYDSCNENYTLINNTCYYGNCIGSNNQSCTISNGQGIQNRTCDVGNWTNWSSCTAISCNQGYDLINNTCIDDFYPQFSNYHDNNNSLTSSGIGTFNITVQNTNGTVLLEINGTNVTASNATYGDSIYNATYTFTNHGNYVYRWYAYGNGATNLLNVSASRIYMVANDTTSPVFTYIPPNATITYLQGWPGINFNATDNVAVAGFFVNDSKFTINSTGFLNKTTTLAVGNYTLNISVNDTAGNIRSTIWIFTVNKNIGSCSVLFNETSPLSYPKNFTVWTNCTSASMLYRNGTTISNNSVQSLAIGTYNFTVQRNDSQNYTNVADTKIFIVSLGVAPIIQSSIIRPSPAYTNDSIRGYCNATDADGGNITYIYAWYLNGILNASGTTPNYTQGIEINVGNISNSSLAIGQNWTLECQANDSQLASSRLNSTITTIQDNNTQTGNSTIMASGMMPSGKSYLIHDQEFVLPQNAVNGDTPGVLSQYWNMWYNITTTYNITNSDGTFTIDNSGKLTLVNSTAISNKTSIAITVLATNNNTLESGTANITITILPANNTYFIDPTVASNGNGSRNNPYNSWSNATITAGNNYLQKRGTTNNISAEVDISLKNNILIGAYGNDSQRPIVMGMNISGHVFNIQSDNIVVRDLEISAPAAQSGIKFTGYYLNYTLGSFNATIDDCKAENSKWGFRALTFDTVATGLKIVNNEVSYTGDDGMFIEDKQNAEFAYNYIHDVNQEYFQDSAWCLKDHPNDTIACTLQNYSAGDGIQITLSTQNNSVDGFYIHHNIIDRSTTSNKFCVIVNTAWSNLGHGRIENNYLKRMPNSADVAIYISHNAGNIVRYNTIENGGIMTGDTNLTIAYNIFINGSTLFLSADSRGGTCNIYNNVFYGSFPSHMNSYVPNVTLFLDYGQTYNIKNNIFYGINTTSNWVYDGNSGGINYTKNIYYPTIKSTDNTRDTGAIISDPLFTNISIINFRLKAGSPAINTGVYVGETKDYYGNDVQAGNVSIGIYNGNTTNNSGGDNSSSNILFAGLLSGKSYLIHNQEFVLPQNAVNGDTPGTLSQYWNNWYNMSMIYNITNSDGTFTIDNSGKLTLVNSTAIVNQTSIVLSVLATNNNTQENQTANITITILPTSNTYFIDPTAGSNGVGTRASPYNSWGNATITAGKNYLQKRGTTNSVTTKISIVQKDNILVGSYGNSTQRPKIIALNMSGSHIFDVASDNIVIRDMDINATFAASGIKFVAYDPDPTQGSHNDTIDDCRIQNSEWGFRSLTNDGLRILNSEIAHVGNDGIYIEDKKNAEIAYNYVHDVNEKYLQSGIWCQRDHPDNTSQCELETYSGGDGIQLSGENSDGESINGFNIHHNIVDHSSTGNKFDIIANGDTNGSDHGVIENNYLKRAPNSVDVAIYTHFNTGDLIRYNTIENGGIMTHGVGLTISYNIFKNASTLFLLYPDIGGYNCSIYNNIFYGAHPSHPSGNPNSENALIYFDYNQQYNIKNNIFYYINTTTTNVSGGNSGGINYTKNIYYPTINSQDHSRDTLAIISDPLFTNISISDFRIQTGSPAINTGVYVNETKDYYGNTVQAGNVSIGVYNGNATS